MGIVELLKMFFQSITGVSKAVEVRTKPESVRISEHEIRKERLTVAERKKMLNQATTYMRLHLRQSVDGYSDVTFDSLDEDDKQDLKEALYELFPNRKHKKAE